MRRRKTRTIQIGNVKIGGKSPISVQSMTNTDTRNVKQTVQQINELAQVGCDIVRIAVPDTKSVESLPKIIAQTKIPIIADIHFNYQLAIESIKKGVDGIRINPGNIGKKDKIRKIIRAAQEKNIPIRIGINSGSLEKDLKQKYGVSSEAITKSALRHLKFFEECGFYHIKISLKSSSVPLTIESYRKMAKLVDYPFHLGITEAGTRFCGTIKSAVGIGTLLAEGIGDTIRVSLTANPIEEVKVGIEILKSMELREGPNIISCPTCGRCEIDIIRIAQKVEAEVQKLDLRKNITVAIMGCTVNGPGEAKEADIGIAAGKGKAVLFEKGKIVKSIAEENIVPELLTEIKQSI